MQVDIVSVRQATKFVHEKYISWNDAASQKITQWVSDDGFEFLFRTLTCEVLISVHLFTRPGITLIVLLVNSPEFNKIDWKYVIASVAITFAVGTAALWFTHTQIYSPLRRIEKTMKAIANLDSYASSEPSRVSEISSIVSTFGQLNAGTIWFYN